MHPVARSDEARAYMPRAFNGKLQVRRIPNDDCGSALVDFSSIPGEPLWLNDSERFFPTETSREIYAEKFRAVREPVVQFYAEDNDPEHPYFVNWAAWTLPTLNLAFFRRTG
jgi:hypothetical protein